MVPYYDHRPCKMNAVGYPQSSLAAAFGVAPLPLPPFPTSASASDALRGCRKVNLPGLYSTAPGQDEGCCSLVAESDLQCQPIGKAPSSASSSSRRSFISLATAFAAATTTTFTSPQGPLFSSADQSPSFVANAAETIGKDESCNGASCLGVWDGLLADCPHDGKYKLKGGGGAGCVSSQDDTPGVFAEPWDYSDNVPLSSSSQEGDHDGDGMYVKQMDQLILALETASRPHGDEVKVTYQEGRYLRATFADGSSGEKSIGEFYFTPNDTTVQFRIGSISSSSSSGIPSLVRSLPNNERSERIRKQLRYLKVPVLRNRKRTLFFVENDDWDGFGPGSAALGPPEEMSPGELGLGLDEAKAMNNFGLKAMNNGDGGRTRRGSDDVEPKLRIDWVESFPFDGNSKR